MSLEPRQSVHLVRLRALLRVSLAQDVVGAGLMVTYPRRPEVLVLRIGCVQDRLMMESVKKLKTCLEIEERRELLLLAPSGGDLESFLALALPEAASAWLLLELSTVSNGMIRQEVAWRCPLTPSQSLSSSSE